MDEEEVVIGRAQGTIHLEQGENTFNTRPLCTNCRGNKESKRLPIHCQVTSEHKIKMRCNPSAICECLCRTHYICRHCGRLHPYGETCQAEMTMDGFKTGRKS